MAGHRTLKEITRHFRALIEVLDEKRIDAAIKFAKGIRCVQGSRYGLGSECASAFTKMSPETIPAFGKAGNNAIGHVAHEAALHKTAF